MVFAVLRSRGVRPSRRLAAVLEIESGANDPMAIFLTIGLIECPPSPVSTATSGPAGPGGMRPKSPASRTTRISKRNELFNLELTVTVGRIPPSWELFRHGLTLRVSGWYGVVDLLLERSLRFVQVHPYAPGLPIDAEDVSMDAVATRIVEAATAEFARRGLPGARMARIARQAGVSTASIHYHFTSKRRLYEAVLDRAAATLRAEAARVSREGCPRRAAISCLSDVGARNPLAVRLLVHDLLMAGAPRGARLSLRQALHDGAAALRRSSTWHSGDTIEPAGVVEEALVAGALLAGALSEAECR